MSESLYAMCPACAERMDIALIQRDAEIECVCGHRFVAGQFLHRGAAHPRGFSPLRPAPAIGSSPAMLILLFGLVGLVLVVFMGVVLELPWLMTAVICGLLLFAAIVALLIILVSKQNR